MAATALAAGGTGAGGHAYLASRGATEPPAATDAVSPPSRMPPPEAPRNVPPLVLEQHRIHDDRITPDDATRTEMASAKVTRVIGSFKVCLDATGAVTTVDKLKSTGFEAYDRKIEAELLSRRYRPVEVDGKPGATCTAQTFVYRNEHPQGE
ncbi:MAG TPA: hypothetical protein VN253_27560 [Kofleriaceae bacterium]|nr:hypothetical protein [Kofleriaceae bacterium]